MGLSLAEADARLTAPGQPFEVAEDDVGGARLRVWRTVPRSLRDVLDISRRYGERTFLVYEDERMTFEEHYRAAAHFACRLVEGYGVAKGDRVAIAMRNFPEWVVAFWGAAAAGAVVVPLNAWWTGEELAYGLADSGAKVLVADGDRAARLAPHWAGLPDLGAVMVSRSDEVAAGHERFDDVVGGVPVDARLPDVAIEPEDDATIFYTSGTTGRPKGALGTHRNICTNLWSLLYVAARSAFRSKGVSPGLPGPSPTVERVGGQNAYLLSVPFFHATGCHSVLVSNTAAGGKLVIMHKWDPERALELIERERVTTFGGVPSMVLQVLDSADFEKRDTSSVRTVSYGGAPAPPDLVRRIKRHFPGGQPSNGYGLTETSSVTSLNSGDDYVRKPESVGRPMPVVEVKVVDDSGRELATGEVGELWVRGPNVVKGYWNKPSETAATFTPDRWLRTGDVARLDDEGFIYIVDRAKDMLIRGGENVYCVEVESVLFEHPAVADAAVIGIPHPVLGEEVGAVVQLRPGTAATATAPAPVTADDLRAHVARHLAAFKVPVRIWFRDEPLPRNPAGKVLKRQLRDELVG